ncbi:helix-turn-helix transcriptional regulator [Floricoccus penangensis]|uniref:Transcriptional regulator n=1 Tax=Floricoccus penangensis TaxID=1859475 RepID=A0A9Q5JH35_9LACT|nr:helix-turn-helix transcriptional regulator [Floricoccus penangensis]OFI47438.1 transcriptional regulator [Floricoccus penangensis]URZ87440.1 helix-turn-helix transcriptional regulator [Floricoccus penangensis]
MKTRLRELREAEGISQTALADILEVSRQTIISLESGKYKASLVLAHKIAQYFDKTIEDIFIFDLEEENL